MQQQPSPEQQRLFLFSLITLMLAAMLCMPGIGHCTMQTVAKKVENLAINDFNSQIRGTNLHHSRFNHSEPPPQAESSV